MNGLRVDHTAVAVRDMDEALERYRRIYGVGAAERHTVSEQGVEVAFLPVGDTELELVAPLNAESGVARFLDRHGEGLHHIGMLVEDIEAELLGLAADGVRLIDQHARSGPHGLIAFIHPEQTGLLVELVQRRR